MVDLLNANSLTMSSKKILITGANGQLGWELAQLTKQFNQFEFILLDRSILDLSKPDLFDSIINEYQPAYIINTAAYTAVDKAESEPALATLINSTAVATLARIAKNKGIRFITYSTDYVFNGTSTVPYTTDESLDPINFYGKTKADGETLAMTINPNTIIIRTSWVFSSHGNNFVKTMLRLMKDRESLNVVADQKGRPTYAKDLALATMEIVVAIEKGQQINGVFHYANKGVTSWYAFAEKIKQNAGLSCQINPITTNEFPTPAKRPSYSVLDTSRIENELGITIPDWEVALLDCQNKLDAINGVQ